MKIELYNSKLDNSYKNIIDYRILKDKDDNFINRPTLDQLLNCFNTLLTTHENVNFNFGDFLKTSITITYDSRLSGVVPNYLRAIPETTYECILTKANRKYPLYYFITSSTQLNYLTYKYDLELDVMTSFFHQLDFYTPITLERRHCERFGYATTDKKYFTYNRDCLLDNTSIEPNILTSTRDLSYNYSQTGDNLNLVKTLKECKWLYIFLSNNTPLTTDNEVGQFFYQYRNGWQQYPIINNFCTSVNFKSKSLLSNIYGSMPFLTLVFPVYTSVNANDMVSSTLTKGVEDVLSCVSLTPYILSAKLSNRCPFTDSQILSNFQTSKSSNGYYLLKDSSRTIFTDKYTYPVIIHGGRDYTLGFFISYQDSINKMNIEPYLKSFDTLPSVTDTKDITFEPQLYTSKYCKQGIKLYNKDLMNIEPYYLYNSAKIDTLTKELTIYQYTFLNYDTTTIVYPYQNCGLINEGKSYVNNSDFCVVNDNYQQAMANSKNSMYTGLESQIYGGMTSSLLSMAKAPKVNDEGKITTNVEGNIISSAIGGSMDIINNVNNFNAKLKDLQNTPNSIKIQGMDILNELTTFSNGIGHYISYSLDTTQQQIVYDYYYNYGYQVNKNYLLSPKIEYGTNAISRKLFNYIKINDDDFIYKSSYLLQLPAIIRNKIYSIFKQGFKLWSYIDCDESFIKSYLFSNTNENVEIYDIKEL